MRGRRTVGGRDRFDRGAVARRRTECAKEHRQGVPGAQPAAVSATPKADEPIAFQAMMTKYCVGCHNQRNPLPAGAPLALDTANLADPGADA